MKIRTIHSIKLNGNWVIPGSCIEVDDDIARSLIRKNAAEVFEIPEFELPESNTSIVETLCQLEEVNVELANRLIQAGYTSIKSIADAEPDDLKKVKGIGKKTVAKIQESADDILSEEDD